MEGNGKTINGKTITACALCQRETDQTFVIEFSEKMQRTVYICENCEYQIVRKNREKLRKTRQNNEEPKGKWKTVIVEIIINFIAFIFPFVLGLFVYKLLGNSISWLWVFSPVWIPLLVGLLLFLIWFVFMLHYFSIIDDE